ncbi:MAG: hypothetical protein ACLRT5_20210 [Lachnospiraceae bacterium]
MEKARKRILSARGVLPLCQAGGRGVHGPSRSQLVRTEECRPYFDLFGIPLYRGPDCLSGRHGDGQGDHQTVCSRRAAFRHHAAVELKSGKARIRIWLTMGMELPVVVKTWLWRLKRWACISRGRRRSTEEALEGAFSYEDEVVVEEYIEGREFSVGVVDGKAYPIIEIAPVEGFYDYKNKYSAGATIDTCPAVLTEEQTRQMQTYAEAGCKALAVRGICTSGLS